MAKRISDRKTDSSIRRFMLSKVNRRLIYVLLLLVAVILVGVFADRIAPYEGKLSGQNESAKS